MAAERELKVAITGDASQLNRSLKKAKGGLGGLGKSAGLAAGAMAAVGVAAAGALAVKGVNASMEFDQSMREVFTLLPGITDDAMSGMKDQVKDFSKEFGVLPDEVVPALYSSLSAGVPKDNVFDFMATAQQAAKGGVTELETAVDGISSVMNAYGEDTVNATQASDMMFTAVKLGKTTFGELSSSLSNVTPIASGLGVGFDDVSAALAAMTAKGIKTPQATTKLNALFVELSRNGGKTATAFEEVANVSFAEFMENGHSLEQALDLMNVAAENNDVALQDMFGSVEAGSAALTLFDNAGFTGAVDEMGNSAGATEAAFETMDQGLSPLIDKVKAWGAVMLIEIGDKVVPLLEDAAAWVQENWPAISKTFSDVMATIMSVVQPVMDWFQANWPAISAIALEAFDAIAVKVEEVWPMIQGHIQTAMETVASIIETVTVVITKAWEMFGDDIWSFVQRVWPRIQQVINGVMTAVMGVINAVLAIIRGDWGQAWNAIKSVFTGVWEAIQGLFFGYMEYLKLIFSMALQVIQTVWSVVWDAMKNAVGEVWAAIQAAIGLAADAVMVYINAWLTVLTAIWDAIWWAISGTIDLVWSTIQTAVETAIGLVSGIISGALELITGIWSGAWNGYVTIVQTIMDTIKTTISGGIDAVVGFVTALPGKLLETVGALTSAALDLGAAIVGGILDGLAGFAEGAVGFAGDVLAAVGDIAKGAINGIIQGINDMLPDKVGKISVAGVTIFPGIDLPNNPIPSIHSGGTFNAPVPGGEGLALLRDGERVSARGSMDSRGGRPQIIQVMVDGRVLTEAVVRETQRNGPARIKVVAR